ncbi:MAG: hypothetical protein A2W76_03370 [Gammaproteobacteria bacterium RIFCSPLOWO2_12_47_11]|nr:MAG: hypothetical protein A2W76_03370 [Gammaproteobacteria bacterium RIFCSPLOWO2_12_47_11]
MLTIRKDIFYSRPARMLKRMFWYPLRKLWWPIAVKRAVQSELPPVLVYHMGKVASSSVYASLKRIRGLHVFQVCYLHPQNIAERSKHLQINMEGENISYLFDCSKSVYSELIESNLRIKVITLVRDPIARNVSGYFHSLSFYNNGEKVFKRLKQSDLINNFIYKFPHEIALNWFDIEFKPITGIDVYAYPFPQEQGYQVISSGRFDILVMRHDLDDGVKKHCLSEFLEINDIDIIRKNTAEEKSYSLIYRQFIQLLQFDRAFLNKMLDSKYASHFYLIQEREKYKAFWSGLKSEQTNVAAVDL